MKRGPAATILDSQTKRLPASQKYALGVGAIGKDAVCNLAGAWISFPGT